MKDLTGKVITQKPDTLSIPEAITILAKEQKDHHSFPTDIIGKAELLGIKALERCEEAHRTVYLTSYVPLEGETERRSNEPE